VDVGRLPIDEQMAAFQAALSRNGTLAEVLAQAAAMDLPGWYLVPLEYSIAWLTCAFANT
jgi:hypothetical protein